MSYNGFGSFSRGKMDMETKKIATRPRPKRRALRVVLAVLFILFAWYTLAGLFSSEQGVGHFVSVEEKGVSGGV